MCERYSELLVGSMVHDLRSILTHLRTNCYSLIEEAAGEPKAKVRRTGARVRSDLEFLEMTIEDMNAFTQPPPTDRRRERLAVVVADALELARDNVRKSKLDPDTVTVQVDVPESIVVEIARHQIVMALANVLEECVRGICHQRPTPRRADRDHRRPCWRPRHDRRWRRWSGDVQRRGSRTVVVHTRPAEQDEEAKHRVRPADCGP